MKKWIAIASLALALPAFAGADQQKEMECLVGSWKVSGTAKLPGSDKLHNVNGSYDCKKSGGAIVCALNLSGLPDGMKLEEVDTWAYNAGDDSMHMFSADNMGGAADVVGRITAPSFHGRYEGTYQSKPYQKEVSGTFANKNRFTLTCTCNFGSKLDVTLIRA